MYSGTATAEEICSVQEEQKVFVLTAHIMQAVTMFIYVFIVLIM